MSATHSAPIQYQLHQHLLLNDFLGRTLTLEWTGDIHCIQCNRKIKQSFQQGYCFPCLQKINECNNCMIHPERCLVEQGDCDPNDWAHEQCDQPHFVYLANTSGLKVGITRTKNNPSRWIDQGAIQALPIFQTQNRYQAGFIEVALKKFVDDKTNWRVMLRGVPSLIDLIAERERLLALLGKNDFTLLDNQQSLSFEYPVLEYPQKLISLSFDKTPRISGVLQGIKGQYLMLDMGVLNIRKFGGYVIL